MRIEQVKGWLDRLKELRIAVIGDIMLDEYLWGRVERISPEAPIQVVEVEREERDLGGAGNVVKNIVPWGPRVFFFGVVGNDLEGETVKNMLREIGVDTEGVYVDGNRRTTIKTRVIAESQQVVRIDKEVRDPIDDNAVKHIVSKVMDIKDELDGIIVSDYGKGVVTGRIVRELRKGYDGPITVDPKKRDLSIYKGVNFIKPNKKEFSEIMGFEGLDLELEEAGKRVIEKYGLDGLLVTLGKDGMKLFLRDKEPYHIFSTAKEVYDVTGAGDTVISLFSSFLFAGADPILSAEVANISAGIAVSKVGAKPVYPFEFLSILEGSGKLLPLEILKEIIDGKRREGKRIVMTSGCFDMIHPGQIIFLKKSKELGDVLVIALNSDESIRRIKGKGRPVLSLEDRVQILSHLSYVDYIVVFGEDAPVEVIKVLKPDVYVKGRGIDKRTLPEKEAIDDIGCEVVILPELHEYSSSKLIEKIRNS